MKRADKGFTIIELMAVVAIIGLLLSFVMTAAANSMRLARNQKTTAICKCVQQGLENYRQTMDRWPNPLGSRIESGQVVQRTNQEGANNQNDAERYVLEASEVRDMIKELVRVTLDGNQVMDISGLYVSRDPGEGSTRGTGLDFLKATRERHWPVSTLYYGYPDENRGYFRRLKMVYAVKSDSMEVTK